MDDETTTGWRRPDGTGSPAPTPTRPEDARGAASSDAGWPPPADGRQAATVLAPYAAAPSRRRRPGVIATAVASVLAVAAATFAVTSLAADDAPSSPEAAVQAMFDAIEDEDVLGVLDALAPGEREVYQPFVQDVVGELQRLDVLSGELDLGDVGGFELEVDGLELRSAPLGDGVAAVTVLGGTITSTVDPAGVPLGSFVRELLDDPESGVDLSPVTSTAALAEEEPVDLVVIDDGGWHVSLHYSLAELARREAGAPVPAFGEGVQPDGADTPEAAVQEIVQAAVDLDLRRAIALTPPGEMSVLHDYAPLFLDQAEQAVAELRAETDFDISVDRLDTEAERNGDTALVTITGFAASGVVAGEPFEAAYDGTCFSGSFDGESEEICPEDLDEAGAGASGQELLEARMGIVVVERDGEWFVSPVRSALDSLVAVLRALDESVLDDPTQLFAGASAFGLGPLLYGTSLAGDGMVDDSSWGSEQVTGDPGVTPTTVPGGDPYAHCDAILGDLPVDATSAQVEEADAAYQLCTAGLDGSKPGEAPEDDCWLVYDELGPDATEEDLLAADRTFEECLAATGAG